MSTTTKTDLLILQILDVAVGRYADLKILCKKVLAGLLSYLYISVLITVKFFYFWGVKIFFR